MTTKRIVWQAPDGTILLSIPVRAAMDGEPERQYLDSIAMRAQNADPSLRDAVRLDKAGVEAADLPDRRFRNCWRHDGKIVAVDLPLARAQVLAEVRHERDARLVASDKDKARIDDIGTPGERQALAAKRQALRDLPATVAADLERIDTVESLAAYRVSWPE